MFHSRKKEKKWMEIRDRRMGWFWIEWPHVAQAANVGFPFSASVVRSGVCPLQEMAHQDSYIISFFLSHQFLNWSVLHLYGNFLHVDTFKSSDEFALLVSPPSEEPVRLKALWIRWQIRRLTHCLCPFLARKRHLKSWSIDGRALAHFF